MRLPRAVAEEIGGMTFDEFVGPHTIGDQYEIDGTDPQFEPIWNTPMDDAPIVELDDGYAIHTSDDPRRDPGEILLLVYEGDLVGFYADAQSWIDPEHRGRGLSIELILAACALNGGRPYRGYGGESFSPAGIAAHRAAYAAALDQLRHQPAARRATAWEHA